MRGHNVCFHREIRKIIFKLSSIPPPIWSSGTWTIFLLVKLLTISCESLAEIYKNWLKATNKNKRAKRPWIAHLSIQAKSQTFNFEIWVNFDQSKRMTLTFDTHSTSLPHLVECFKHLWDLRLQQFPKKKNNFHFFPYKSQIWPWRKMCQGQPRVIIWTTLVVLA